MTVHCGECGAPMVLRDSRFGKFYGCSRYPVCKGTHGAHPDGSPLGLPADCATRRARILAHEEFDRLWKGGTMKRNAAYRWLSEQMGMPRRECHIGSFDADTCLVVVQIIRRAKEGKRG